jgi:AraC-like DNA-binding protein
MSNENKLQKALNDLENNSLFISRERALYLGAGFATRFHTFHALKVCIGVDGEFGLRTGLTANYERCRAAVIAPDRFHQLNGRATRLALLFLPQESLAAQQFAETYLNHSISIVPRNKVDALFPVISGYFKHDYGKEAASALCDDLIHALVPAISLRQRFDWRVTRALEYVRSALDRKVTAEEIAGVVRSSHSHLAHLFKAQTGVAIRHYRRWLRVCAAIEQMADINSLTDIAHAAGFFDSSDLTHTFRQMLGIAPSTLFRKSRVFRDEIPAENYK